MGLFNIIKGLGGNTLYYPGCLTKGVLKQEFENYKKIFNKLGIDFILIPDKEVCCGLPVLNAGYKKEARKLAEKNFDVFKEKNIKKIITNCPSCFHTFKSVYPGLVKNWDIEVEHATQSIFNALTRRNIDYSNINEDEKEIVAYHDPCHLGRYEGVYQEPREVLRLLGCKIIEMRNSKLGSLCCGGGGGVRANFPELARSIARLRIKEMPKQATKIISPCGLCFSNLQTATDKSEEFSDFVLRKLEEFRR